MIELPNSFQMWRWRRRLKQFNRCTSADEVLQRFGQPAHIIKDVDRGDVWHYPLKTSKVQIFAIHVYPHDDRRLMAMLAITDLETGVTIYRG